MNYDQICKGDLRSKVDKDMLKLQKKVSKDEYMLAIYEMRRRKSKQPTSLTLEQEDRARLRFEANKIKEPKTDQQKEIIDIINIDSFGQLDTSIYHRYKAKMLQEMETKKIKERAKLAVQMVQQAISQAVSPYTANQN